MSEEQSVFAAALVGEEILGMLVLFGAGAQAGPTERTILEYGATALALELSRLRGLAETELRLGRDLVEELVTGNDEAGALAHAEALGYDLARPHRVAAVEILRDGHHADDHAVHAVRRAAQDTGTGTLLAELRGFVVVLADPAAPWQTFQGAVVSQLGGVRCRVGIGGRCERPSDFPRSHREALFALAFKDVVAAGDRAVLFDDLGVYRLFAQGGDVERMERFVDIWLSALIAYDERRGSDLLLTLTRFLECGGAYDRTAELLAIHRNTLKYRLRRIREISGRDLNDPDTAFNLQLAVRAWQTVRALPN